jgi:hypothetical protein
MTTHLISDIKEYTVKRLEIEQYKIFIHEILKLHSEKKSILLDDSLHIKI